VATYGVKLQRSDDLKLVARTDGCAVGTFADWCSKRVSEGARLAVDLFCGAGGLSHGLTSAGWTVAAAVDHDPKALDSHRANFPGVALDVDLADSRGRDSLIRLLQQAEIDLVAGGPPCQPFSRAGRSKIRSLVNAGLREPVDHRKELWRAFVDVVTKVRPRVVLMENVPDMALGDEFFVVRSIVDAFEMAGYRTQVRLIDAWKYGVPQHRQRLILLARLDGGPFVWPEENAGFTTLREAIGDLPQLGLGTGGRRMEYAEGQELSDFARRMRREAEPGVIYDHMTRPVRDDDRIVFRQMTPETLYSAIDPELRRYKADTFDDKYKRLGWEERSRSITAHIAKDGYWYIHPEEHRTLTVREAARIQTFPDVIRFAGTRSDAFRQIGNAVPPLLGEAAARVLLPLGDLTAQAGTQSCDKRDRDWRPVRAVLAEWASSQIENGDWYLFPSKDLFPAVAALVAMIGGQPGFGQTFDVLRRQETVTRDLLDDAVLIRPTQRLVAASNRLIPVVDQPDIGSDPGQIADRLQLRPAETELFRLLVGEDRLVPNQPSVRVADRVLGRESDSTNLRTTGRLDLSLLVGSGDHAPSRMAAIRLIGMTVCRARKQEAVCVRCPLREVCDSSSN
jgi:DNA (cytosine-5)-methyltransferase 1